MFQISGKAFREKREGIRRTQSDALNEKMKKEEQNETEFKKKKSLLDYGRLERIR